MATSLPGSGGFSLLYPQSIGTYTGCVGPGNTYLAAGQAPIGGGYTGAALILVDSMGNVLKTDTLTHPQRSLTPGLRGCAHFADGHYWIAGQAYLRGWVAKLTPNLDTVWSRIFRFNDSVNTVLHGSVMNSSKNFVVTGTASAVPSWDSIGRRTMYLAQFDSTGQRKWERNYFAPEPTGQAMWQWGSGLIESPDGGYLIYGNRAEEGLGNNSVDFLLLKTDSLGQEEWSMAAGTQYSDRAIVARKLSDTSFIAFSSYSVPTDPSLQPRYYDAYLQVEVRRYSDGSVISSKTMSPYYPGNHIQSIVQNKDGGWSVLANYYPEYLSPPDTSRPYFLASYLMKLDSQLDSMWYRELSIVQGGGDYNLLFDLRPTPDNGLVAFGRAQNTSSSIFDVWMVKTDSMGCVDAGCHNVGMYDYLVRNHEFQVYPNPVAENAMIEGPGSLSGQEVKMRLYSQDGRLLESHRVTLPYLYEMGHLKPGAYILKYEHGSEELGQTKLVKM